jgi:solute carrier family 35 protein E3
MIAILSLGWYTEGKTFTLIDIVGVVLAVVGAWQYAVWGKK